MKEKYLYMLLVPSIGLLIALLCTVCSLPKDAQMDSTPATPISTTIDRWEMLPPIPSCQAHVSDDGLALALHSWDTDTDRAFEYLIDDGDRLWIAASNGLFRLDLRTWQCDLFSQIGDFVLDDSTLRYGNSSPSTVLWLPDGAGGLWIGEGMILGHLSTGGKLKAYTIPDGTSAGVLGGVNYVMDLGFQTGDVCVVICAYAIRLGCWPYTVCFEPSDFPPVQPRITVVGEGYAMRQSRVLQQGVGARQSFQAVDPVHSGAWEIRSGRLFYISDQERTRPPIDVTPEIAPGSNGE